MNHFVLPIVIAVLVLTDPASAAKKCAAVYEQCGGADYTGPTCCEQPAPLPGYVNFPPSDSVLCKKVTNHYRQCLPRCSREKPCFFQNHECVAALNGGTDGRGRQFCGERTVCTNPDWCYSDSLSCICGGDVPCALTSRPGGCRKPAAPEDLSPDTDSCGGGARRCPAFEGEQCGGVGHADPTTCQPGLKCVKYSKYYSACMAE